MIKKVAVFMLAVLVLLPVFGQSGRVCAADAETVEFTMANSRSRSSNYGKLVDDTTYFQIRAFSDENGAIDVSWDQNSWTAYVVCNGLNVEATVGKPYIIANGRVIYSGRDNFIENGRLYVPARSICKAFGFEIVWNEADKSVFVRNYGQPIENADSFYNANDLYWLSRIISCEAGGTEPLIGQIAVGNVVLNRVKDPSSPNTVYDVIFDRRFGIQFTPAYTPNIYKEPYDISVIAAKICLEGYSVSEDALFFYSPKYVYAAWIEENREYLFTIGGHKFFS